MKFEVGDRVTTKLGDTGTVIDVERLSGNVAVEMDGPNIGVFVPAFPGKRVLWLSEEAWKKIEQKSKILITSDGHTTTARLYDGKKVTKTAEAKCNPDDKFDFSTGAKLAFDRLMGTEKPKEAKLEPIKLYCVKNYDAGEYVTRGKIYTFDGHQLNYDGALCFYADNFEDWKRVDHKAAEFLFPLVSRPAKVGEWVLMVRDDCVGINKKGSIARVIKFRSYNANRIPDEGWLYDPTGKYLGGISASHSVGYYLVLDGYDGRYEEPEKPKGWNGKVVCVETHDVGFVSGAIYSVIDGALRDKDGEFRPIRSGAAFFRKFDDLNSAAYGKFIEFKGEADAQ